MQFSKAAKQIKPSFVRNILLLTQRPGVISFAGGLPDPTLFPTAQIKAHIDSLTNSSDKGLYQYSPTQGYEPLREALAKEYLKEGVTVEAKNILITTGSQQSLDILCRVLLDVGDNILVESPTYLAALQLFNSHHANILTTSINTQGPNLEEIENTFKQGIKFFYTIPTFQNPTGFTCKDDIREKVVELARKYNVLIIEDNPYGNLRFEGETPKSYMALYPEKTLTMGTASKIAAPDFRLGWSVGPVELIEACVKFKECTDLQCSYFFQRVLEKFITSGELDEHLKVISKEYKLKRDTMVKALSENFGDELKVDAPEGGMFVWATIKNGKDALDLFNECVKKDVAFVPGFVFYPCESVRNTMRINFSHSTCEMIVEGAKRMKEAYNELMKH